MENGTNQTTEIYDDPAYIGLQVACVRLMIRAGVVKDVGEYVSNGHAAMFDLYITGAARVATDEEVLSAREKTKQILTQQA